MAYWEYLTDAQRRRAIDKGFNPESWNERQREIHADEDVDDYVPSRNYGVRAGRDPFDPEDDRHDPREEWPGFGIVAEERSREQDYG